MTGSCFIVVLPANGLLDIRCFLWQIFSGQLWLSGPPTEQFASALRLKFSKCNPIQSCNERANTLDDAPYRGSLLRCTVII